MDDPEKLRFDGVIASAIGSANTLANTAVVHLHEPLILTIMPSWFNNAPSFVREALRESIARGYETQKDVARIMAQIKSMEQFAEPLLKAALTAQGWSDINPRTHGLKEVHLLSNLLVFLSQQQLKMADTFIQLLLPDLLVPQTLEINIVSSITHQSLLQAAMQNFEAAQTVSPGFDPGTMIFKVLGNLTLTPSALKPEAFAAICRNLNLGQQYQLHLGSVFEPPDDLWPADDPRSQQYTINKTFSLNKRYAFASALHLAYMKGQLNATHYMFVLNLLATAGRLSTQGHPSHSTLELMSFEVPGIIIIWPELKPVTQAQRCMVYLPQSPLQPFHLFQTFDAFKVQLREWLKRADFSRYFAGLVPLRHRAEFMRRTNIKKPTWDSLLIVRPPIINEPALFLETRHIAQSGDPFEVAWRLQRAQIKDDARVLLVPTEDEDTKSRVTRIAAYLNLGLSLLGIALGFIPGLGEVLLAVSVIQLGAEVFEGIKAWSRGDRIEALNYMFDIAQNVALAASTAGVVKALKPSVVVDGLVPVTTVQGHKRLWVPDLKPYEVNNAVLTGIKQDARGMYATAGQSFIKLDGKVFAIKTDPATRQGYIQHPQDSLAYTPKLQHNNNGTWTHELDNPRLWRREQLFKRLGSTVESFSGSTMEGILQASNTTDEMLYALLTDNLPLPPALVDCIKRVRLCEQVERFILQMKQGINGSIDNAPLQLELLTELPGWPADRVLRVVDIKGERVKDYGSDLMSPHSRLQVSDTQISNGDLLKVALEGLSPEQRAVLLGGDLGSIEQQVLLLSRKLSDYAGSIQQHLITRLYNASEVVKPELSVLKRQFPGLPVSVLNELMSHLRSDEINLFKATDRLPLSVLEEARCYVQTLRINRALEGLFFKGLSSSDTQTIAWSTLARLPGWPDNLGLVLRDKNTGLNLEILGHSSAVNRVELFKDGDAYEFFGSAAEDVYRSPQILKCVAQALSPSARLSLGLPVADAAETLSIKVAHLAGRERVRSAKQLGLQSIKPWLKSPMRLANGRIGYTLGGRAGHMVDGNKTLLLKHLVLELYPLMSEVQAGQFLHKLQLSPALATQALASLKSQLQTLRSDLEKWVATPVRTQPYAGPQTLMSAANKRSISQLLICAWRRQTTAINFGDHIGYELDLNSWPVDCLPVLAADFDHISALHLTNSPNGNLPSHFLQRFPNLRVLSMSSNNLHELPGALAYMPHLTDLNLQGNRIVLNAGAVTLLSGLSKLKSLNLTGNTLGLRFSVRHMPELEHLLLRYTGITEWPEGVHILTHLKTLDLRDNMIRHIPHSILANDMAAVNRVTTLHDNPLNVDSLRRLELYRRQADISLGLDTRHMHVVTQRGISNWAVEPTEQQRHIWNDLVSIRQSSHFFRVLEDLSESRQFLQTQEDLSRRVWTILKGIHEDSALRRRLFDTAANPTTCRNGDAMTFASLELQHQVGTALHTLNTEVELLKLARGLYRLELLDKHVTEVIKARVAAIQAEQEGYVQQLQVLVDAVSPDFADRPLIEMDAEAQQGVAYKLGTAQALTLAQLLSPAAVYSRMIKLDPLEIQMFYHVNLASTLGLPARPTSMIFERIAHVTQAEINVAKDYVLNQETSSSLRASIEGREFWGEFLEKKYPEQFKTSDDPHDISLDTLYSLRESNTNGQYLANLEVIGQGRQQSREQLIAKLTQQELEAHPFSQPEFQSPAQV